jgi:DNA-binding PadR family transcriptional regulator
MVTLDRLQCAGLVYSRSMGRGGAVFRVTARGRRELALQHSVWSSAADFRRSG